MIKHKIIKTIYDRLGTEVLALKERAIQGKENFTIYTAELDSNDFKRVFLLEEEKAISLALSTGQNKLYVELV